MKGNITYIWLKTKRALHEESHLSVWWNGINLTNLCTRLDILSLFLIAPIFPLQSWSHHGMTHNIIFVPLDSFYHATEMSKSITILRQEPQTMKISHYILPSNLYYQVCFVHHYYTTRLMLLCCWTPCLMLLKC